ncbi:hypothetical protein [Zobellia barbeyronii]|uniref:Lipoprotein n=1 Tax=Zobellia barbeyronii TaxID=2748009 RepID=A0ABS5WDJ6_9FLAO|nr:hypothetical protein [Zobellia barbeyronii]MBT2161309.1 hypothetical protein [Zobellia barbeyronii]
MKTKFLTGLLIAFIFSGITSCGSLRGISNNGEIICSNYSNDGVSELSVNLVHNMREGYKENQHKVIASSLNLQDAIGTRFDLETLKNYIFDIENEAKKNNKNLKTDRLGVTIYFARYPELKTWYSIYEKDLGGFLGNPDTEGNEKMHTVVMIPYIVTKDSVEVDFNPTDFNTFENGISPEGRYAPSSTETLMGLSATGRQGVSRTVQSGNTTAQNHGGVIR